MAPQICLTDTNNVHFTTTSEIVIILHFFNTNIFTRGYFLQPNLVVKRFFNVFNF